jgi:hypothetical protein
MPLVSKVELLARRYSTQMGKTLATIQSTE